MRTSVLIAALVVGAACSPSAQAPAPAPQAPQAPVASAHPLDALSAQEIEVAAKLIRGAPQFPGTGMFSTIVLKEPLKADVLAYTPGAKFARQAFSIVLDRRANFAPGV